MDLPVVDKEDALGRLDGDVELWNEIRTIWLDDAPNLLAAVRTALDARFADGLRRAAHALKGASANVGAVRVAATARDVERTAPQADWTALEKAVQELSEETESARAALSMG
jgi:HPt (histidine-containing phosphotransfer) domain-containing protein